MLCWGRGSKVAEMKSESGPEKEEVAHGEQRLWDPC